MPNNSARYHLELPVSQSVDAVTMALLNDRMRTIAAALDAQPRAAQAAGNSQGSAGPVELVLSVPGVLAVHSSVAPLVTFQQDLKPTGLIAFVKQAPVGADLKLRLLAGSALVANLTIAAGQTKGTAGGISGNVAANSLVVMDLVQVGTTFPGSDLSVILLF